MKRWNGGAEAIAGAERRTSLTLPPGSSITYNYDAASRLTSLPYKQSVTVIGDMTYTYDAAGNWTVLGGSWARTGLPQPSGTMSCNANDQLLTVGDATGVRSGPVVRFLNVRVA